MFAEVDHAFTLQLWAAALLPYVAYQGACGNISPVERPLRCPPHVVAFAA